MFLPFSCPRTCPSAGTYFCRFRPLLDRVGPWKANSHTVTVKVEYTDVDALRAAVERMGGIWYGYNERHDLYDTKQPGYGFRLPMVDGIHVNTDGKRYWYHPIVLRNDGDLAYDAYGGLWGDLGQLESLKTEYTIAVCERQAVALGWQAERTAEGLTIYHPTGGQMTVNAAGMIDAAGFKGAACHDAIMQLGLPILDAQIKPEYSHVEAEVQVGR